MANCHPTPSCSREREAEGSPSSQAAFNVLRALCMFLVVLGHSGLSYLHCRVPGVIWVVHDAPLAPWWDLLFWGGQSSVLALFFLLSGYVSAQVYQARGLWGFLTHRTRRLLVPMMVAGLVILPVTAAVWAFGRWMCQTGPARWGVAHLWFLEHLYCLCVGHGLLNWSWDRACRVWRGLRSASDGMARLLTRPWGVLFPAGLCAALFYLDPLVRIRTNLSFLPEIPHLSYFGVCFAIGVSLYHGRARLTHLTRWSGPYLILSLAAHAVAGWLLSDFGPSGLTAGGRLALAMTSGLGVWLAVFGLLGLSFRLAQVESPWWRYLANASFWVYLVHVPLVGFLQVLFTRFAAPPLFKGLTVTAVALAVSLGSYRLWNRRRSRSGNQPSAAPVATAPRQAA